MMDGSITVESEYGLGSTFTLRVRQGFVNDIPIGAEVAEKLRNFKYSVAKRNRGKIVRVPMPYAKVLVVDDVPINLNVARGLLKPYGMGVDCVSSGFDAITAIRDEKAHYDAVFMDHMMPEMDGVETVRIIREKIGSDYAKNVPIIALTADAVVGKREMFLSSGFQDFLSKPIDVRDMDAVLNRWVRDKQKETAFQNGVLSESAGARGTIFENWGIGDIDVEKGLVNFDGVIESYVEILESYVKDMPALLGKLRSYTREDIAGYRITAHSVKSSCRIIGAEALGARAESLETAAADSDDEYITGNSAVFIADVEKLIEKLSPFLSKLEAAHPKPLKSEPDPATLAALLEACKSFDISGINKAMDKLESFRYETSAERISWLRDRIDVSDFNGIVELLEEWIS
jgi:CheY-like chemotaxis protein